MPRFRTAMISRIIGAAGYHMAKGSDSKSVTELIRLLRPRPHVGAMIRLGGDGDGGYLIPDELEGVGACFSPGVSDVADFECMLKDRHGIPSYLADGSVSAPPEMARDMDFERRHLGGHTNSETMRLADWVAMKEAAHGPMGDLMLQMDIEGAEWEVIADTSPEVFSRFRIIVVELHGLDLMLARDGAKLLRPALTKLVEQHVPIHLHPNNCSHASRSFGISVPSVMEVTLLREDRFVEGPEPLNFPHPLDRPNVASRADVVLPDAWH